EMSGSGPYGAVMATWTEFADEAAELAALAERRLVAAKRRMPAAVRRDGFPRISRMEPGGVDRRLSLHHGRLSLAIIPGSPTSRDLQRDGRFALHTATVGTQVTEGDVKMWGTATPLFDPATLARFSDDIFDSTGYRFEVGQFD